MKNVFLALLTLAFAANAHASASRTLQADTINATSGTSLAVPTTGANLLSDTAAQTVTNKTLSGSSNTLSNIPASAISSGTLGVANGGTGLGTLTSGAVIVGAGTSTPTFVAPGTNGNVLTNVSGVWTSSAPVTATPSLNGGSASPQTVTAAGGVTLTSQVQVNQAWLSAASAVTVTKTPSLTACTIDGSTLSLHGTSATNTVTLQDQANLASSGLSLNGNWTGGKDSTLNLYCDITQGLWIESSRR